MRALVVAILLAGCTKYARTTSINAPGNVDLTKPLPNENGDPMRFEVPADPGRTSIVVFVMPTFLGGTGRAGGSNGAIEPGLELRFESIDSAKPWFAKNLAVTAGVGFIQIYERRPDHFGALHAELNFRFPSIKGVIPLDLGVGPAFYPDDPEFGAQISMRFMVLTVRARYMERNGFEFWGGYDVPIPFIFSRSK